MTISCLICYAHTLSAVRRASSFPFRPMRYKTNISNVNLPSKSYETTTSLPDETQTNNWRDNPDLPLWRRHKLSLKEKFKGEEWRPKRRVSREAMEGIRLLHRDFPDTFTTQRLGEEFAIGPEAVRRILKSKWIPTSSKRKTKIQDVKSRDRKVMLNAETSTEASTEAADADADDPDQPRKFNMKRITLEDLK